MWGLGPIARQRTVGSPGSTKGRRRRLLATSLSSSTAWMRRSAKSCATFPRMPRRVTRNGSAITVGSSAYPDWFQSYRHTGIAAPGEHGFQAGKTFLLQRQCLLLVGGARGTSGVRFAHLQVKWRKGQLRAWCSKTNCARVLFPASLGSKLSRFLHWPSRLLATQCP